jgi:hypothetical protein
VREFFFVVACPLSVAKDSQGTGSCVLVQVLGNRMFPMGESVSAGAKQL